MRVHAPRERAKQLTVTLSAVRGVAEADAELDAEGDGTVVLPFTPTRLGRAVYASRPGRRRRRRAREQRARGPGARDARQAARAAAVRRADVGHALSARVPQGRPSIDLITFFILRTQSDLTMASPEELSLIPFPTDELFREHLTASTW